MEILTPEHPRWKEFVERLEGVEGCNFHKDNKGEIIWRCAGGTDKSFAKAILEKMGGFNVVATLLYFEENGGHCDCEILLNVDR